MIDAVLEVSSQVRQYDRLSSLIERFKVQAHILCNTDTEILRGNFFILRCMKGFKKLVFLPSIPDNPTSIKNICTENEVLAGARVEFGAPGSQLSAVLPPYVEVYLHEAQELQGLADLVVEEVVAPRCGGAAVINRLCEVVVIRLLRHAIQDGGREPGLIAGLAHPNLAKALVVMHEQPSKAWRLETLAEEAGMSRTQFAVVFKDVVGVTPGTYLSNWRLALARLDLEQGRSLKSVAARVGFTSPIALSRAYKKRYNTLPREASLKKSSAA